MLYTVTTYYLCRVLTRVAFAPYALPRLSQMYQNPVFDSLAGVSIAGLLGVMGLVLTEVQHGAQHNSATVFWVLFSWCIWERVSIQHYLYFRCTRDAANDMHVLYRTPVVCRTFLLFAQYFCFVLAYLAQHCDETLSLS